MLYDTSGKFLARVTGKVKGNVILREQQYASTKSEEQSLEIAKNCILGRCIMQDGCWNVLFGIIVFK